MDEKTFIGIVAGVGVACWLIGYINGCISTTRKWRAVLHELGYRTTYKL